MSRLIENRWLNGLKRCRRTLGWFSKPRAQTEGLGMRVFGECTARQRILQARSGSLHRGLEPQTLFHGGWRFGKRISCAYPCRETEFPRRRAFPNPQFGNEAKMSRLRSSRSPAGCAWLLTVPNVAPDFL